MVSIAHGISLEAEKAPYVRLDTCMLAVHVEMGVVLCVPAKRYEELGTGRQRLD